MLMHQFQQRRCETLEKSKELQRKGTIKIGAYEKKINDLKQAAERRKLGKPSGADEFMEDEMQRRLTTGGSTQNIRRLLSRQGVDARIHSGSATPTSSVRMLKAGSRGGGSRGGQQRSVTPQHLNQALPEELRRYLDQDGDGRLDAGMQSEMDKMLAFDVDKDNSIDLHEHEMMMEKMALFDEDRNGRINFREFQKACDKFCKPMSKSKMIEMFNKLDKDKDGEIDLPEFITSDLMDWKIDKAAGAGGHNERTHAFVHENAGHARMFASNFDRAKQMRKTGDDLHAQKACTEELANMIAQSKLGGNRYASGAQLVKAFQFFDTDASGVLSKSEIKAAMDTLGIPISSQTMRSLVSAFDKSGDGSVNYHEFAMAFLGESAGRSAIYRPLG